MKNFKQFIKVNEEYEIGDSVLYDGSKAIIKDIFPDSLHLDWNDELIEVGINNVEPWTENKLSDDQLQRVEDILIEYTEKMKKLLEDRINSAKTEEERNTYLRSYWKLIPKSFQSEGFTNDPENH